MEAEENDQKWLLTFPHEQDIPLLPGARAEDAAVQAKEGRKEQALDAWETTLPHNLQ